MNTKKGMDAIKVNSLPSLFYVNGLAVYLSEKIVVSEKNHNLHVI